MLYNNGDYKGGYIVQKGQSTGHENQKRSNYQGGFQSRGFKNNQGQSHNREGSAAREALPSKEGGYVKDNARGRDNSNTKDGSRSHDNAHLQENNRNKDSGRGRERDNAYGRDNSQSRSFQRENGSRQGYSHQSSASRFNSNRIRAVETAEDIKADIMRIEKEIELEIKEIRSMRLGL